ncbi:MULTISPECIES: hypothetical protein [unclassified Nocardioides]|uniref:hypothetical protein n=1 Tax=unclassified Nocardioides TaxID=2615069 RepID=UPI0036078113
MHPLTLRRLSGYAAIAAGPLCILGGMLHPIDDGHAHNASALASDHTLGSTALLAGTVLLLVGLPGVYGWAAPRMGKLGLVGYLLYFVGNLLNAIPHLVIMGFAGHHLAHEHPEVIADNEVILDAPAFEVEQVVTGFGFILGLLLFSIALVRAQGMPRWIGWVGVASALILFVPLPVVPVLTGLQIELLRGVLIVALGVLTVRSVRPGPGSERDDRAASVPAAAR